MSKRLELPAGYDPEIIAEYAKEQQRHARNEWNRTHPEQVEQQRIRTYIRFLAKRGYSITAPEGVNQIGQN